MYQSQVELLKSHKLRTTSSRSAILKFFFKQDHALSYSDIEKEVALNFDRVTVYRTLKSFVDKGVIHKVLDDSGSLKYALCNTDCSTIEHHHDHVHFKCLKCNQTSCLNDVEVPPLNLPKGYKVRELNVLIQGICNTCQ